MKKRGDDMAVMVPGFEQLKFKYLGVDFDIELRTPVVAVGGDSGTGKTLFFKALTDRQRAGFQRDVVLADYAVLNNQFTLLELIKRTENKLIVIDNADILMVGDVDWREVLQSDKTNQYLLFKRFNSSLGRDLVSVARFIRSGTTVRTKYVR